MIFTPKDKDLLLSLFWTSQYCLFKGINKKYVFNYSRTFKWDVACHFKKSMYANNTNLCQNNLIKRLTSLTRFSKKNPREALVFRFFLLDKNNREKKEKENKNIMWIRERKLSKNYCSNNISP
jgi:hypothetical protein